MSYLNCVLKRKCHLGISPLEGSCDDGISNILHQPSSIHLIPAGTALDDSPLGLVIHSPQNNDSVAYVRTGCCLIQPADTANLGSQNPKMYAILKKMPNRILGGVLDNGDNEQLLGGSQKFFITWVRHCSCS